MGRNAIICVDDESIILWSMLQEISDRFGERFEYRSATDPLEVIPISKTLRSEGFIPVLIVSDWLMPGLRGDELISKLALEFPELKAVIVTGHSNEEILQTLRKNPNIIDIVIKPWMTDKLISILENAVDTYGLG